MERMLQFLLVIVATLGMAAPCVAQTFTNCAGPELGIVRVSPLPLTIYDTVSLTAGANGYDPSPNGGTVATVQGNVITVTLTASSVPRNQPTRTCATTSISPLPAGDYIVNLLVNDPASGTVSIAEATARFTVYVTRPLCLTQSSSAVIAFSAPAPTSSQVIAVTVGASGYIDPVPALMSAVAVVQGNSINITLTAMRLGFTAPPLECTTTSIGPLAPGTYQVNLFLNDTNSSLPQPSLAGTTTLTVTPGFDPAAVPGLSGVGIGALTLLLSLAGLFTIRRRQSPSPPTA